MPPAYAGGNLPPVAALLNLVALLAFFVKGVAGFGPALFLVPLWSLFLPLKTGIPATAFLLFLANLPMLALVRRHLDARRDLAAALPYALGIVLGTRLLLVLPEAALRRVLGGVLLAFAGWILLRPAAPERPPAPGGGEALRLALVGFSGGFLVGMVGAGALPFLIYTPLRYPKDQARALFTAVFALGTLVWTATYAAVGLLGRAEVGLALSALPGTLAGLALGQRVAERLSPEGFARLVGLLLVYPALRLLGVV